MSKDWVSEAEALDDWLGDEDEDGNFAPTVRTLLGISTTRVVTIVKPYDKVAALAVYETSKAARQGSSVCCPTCDKRFTKASAQQAFCSNKGRGNCKDVFWNRAKPERMERAKEFARY